MADNVAITPGTGVTVAADDIGGVLHQRVKTTWGPDGTANDTDVATGKPLPVQLRSSTGLIPFGEPTDAKSTATDTTSATGISIWKQISASIQALAARYSAATYVDKSGTITTGATAQTVAAINANRRGFFIQNLSTEDMWLSATGTGAATQPSLWIPPGSYFEFPATGVPTTALSLYGATTGQAFSAREW